jgi:hypothetical protein
MEQLMIRNGVVGSKLLPNVPKPPVPKVNAYNKGKSTNTPLFWLTRDHGERIAQEFGSENVKQELIKLWISMNPAQRRPYILKAETSTQRKKRQQVKEEVEPKKEEIEDDGIIDDKGGGGGAEDDPGSICSIKSQQTSTSSSSSSSYSSSDDE